ncbi:MAG: acetoacetate--CoA ligase [Candidatus Eisenbacteria bacterium]|nr:acetoacetate--CoA ligase [Candidatus Eisenbacteria bacterium]
MTEPLWIPSPERAAQAHVTRFMREVGRPDYASLHAWSLAEPAAFWRAVWGFTGVIGEPGGPVLQNGDRLPGARWFPEARLSFAENLLRRRDEAPAVILWREDGLRREISFRGLYEEVGRLQAAFRRAGLRPGERVAAFLPNIPEAVTCMLAVSSLGGIWSSASPDFGTQAVVDRFGQIEPRFLLIADGYRFKGTVYSSADRLRGVLAGLPTVEKALVVRYTQEEAVPGAVGRAEDFAAFRDAVPAQAPEFPRFPFDQPLYILYSSGTTGKPKCITHGSGGILLQHLKEHQLHMDLGPEDRLFYYTTTGWMMWNWLVSALAGGSTILLYDGSPFHPGPDVLWDMAEREKITVFGTSAKYVDACKKAGLRPGASHDLSTLRTLCSTGSPLAPESFDYLCANVKADLQVASISGGTDICSCFVLGSPVLPVHRGEIQTVGLGMRVEIFDEEGRSVVGKRGELVCTAPAPSMPLGFWGDADGSRYRAAYFERFPGVWHHGDLAEINSRGGVVIHGRSDATLNPGGVRIGTAEIYRQVEQVPEVEESIAVGQDWQSDQRVILFVKLREGLTLDDALRDRIRRRIRENATARHVPAIIVQVPDIPRTRSGKITEIAVRQAIHGRPVENTGALANAEALEHFRDRPELRT